MPAIASRCSRLACAAIRGLFSGHAAVALEPFDLQPRRHVDDHDKVVGGGHPVLGDQRHVVHDDRSGPRRSLQLRHPGPHPRVNDRVQLPAQLRIGEDDIPQSRPVQLTIRAQNLFSERLDDLGQPIGSGGDDIPSDRVGVDDDRPLGGQPLGHLALA
jgi:hypothetical protein